MEWVAISSPGDLPDPGIKSTFPMSPALKEDSLPVEPSGKLLNLNVTVQYTTYCVRVLLLFEIEEFSSFVLSHSVASNSLRPHGLLPCPFSGDLPNPGMEPRSPGLRVGSLPPEPLGKRFHTLAWHIHTKLPSC